MPPAASTDRRLLGIAMRSCAAIAFAVMAALLKASSEHGVSTPELVFYRAVWTLVAVSLWVVLGPGWTAVATRNPLRHVTRTAIGMTSMYFTFGALALLPLGEATTLTYTAPVLSTLLSALLLKEAIGGRRWLAVAGGFAGVLLVARPGGAALPAVGIAVGIAAAFGQSAVMITVRQIARTESVTAIAFWFAALSTLVSAATLPIFGQVHDLATNAMLAAAGLLGGIGQLSMTASLRYAPISVVVPFDYIQIIMATMLGWLIFGSPLLATTIAGAALIAASGIYTAYREGVRGRASGQALAPAEG